MPQNLSAAFANIREHQSFNGLKLGVAVFSIKNASVKPFEEETFDQYMESMQGSTVLSQWKNDFLLRPEQYLQAELWPSRKSLSSCCSSITGASRSPKVAPTRVASSLLALWELCGRTQSLHHTEAVEPQ